MLKRLILSTFEHFSFGLFLVDHSNDQLIVISLSFEFLLFFMLIDFTRLAKKITKHKKPASFGMVPIEFKNEEDAIRFATVASR